MRICILASGSKGNATIFEHEGRSFAIDCGICKRDFFNGLLESGIDPNSLEAILITHEHSDHTKGLGVVSRGLDKLDLHPKLLCSKRVFNASKDLRSVNGLLEPEYFESQDCLSIAGMFVYPFKTNHDCVESFGFRIEADGDAAGFMTDTGFVPEAAFDALRDCRILCLEANHDPRMLAQGPYPYSLQQRIAGDFGHLSNEQSAQALQKLLGSRLEQVAAMHISETNNTYGMPVRILSKILDINDHPAHVVAAYQKKPVIIE